MSSFETTEQLERFAQAKYDKAVDHLTESYGRPVFPKVVDVHMGGIDRLNDVQRITGERKYVLSTNKLYTTWCLDWKCFRFYGDAPRSEWKVI